MKLFRRIVLRPLKADPVRTLISILSVALGVAVVIAIDLAGDAAVGSFQSSLATLTGKVDVQITANGGIDEQNLGSLSALPLRARFTPALEQPVVVEGPSGPIGSATLYGIDLIASAPAGQASAPEPDFSPATLEQSAFVSSDAAARFHWKEGGQITLRGRGGRLNFTIRSIVSGQTARWIGVDISSAQQLLAMQGRLDRIDVFLEKGESAEAALAEIRKTLPSGYEADAPNNRSEEKRKMLAAFRWNLRILSYISLLVGAFFIFNTISVGVVRRRTEIGILRAIGASAVRIQAVFLTEAGVLGLIGSALGIGIGRLLAGGIEGMLSDTVNALFVTSAPSPISLTPASVIAAFIAGTSVALLSALIPAREASRVEPAEAMRRSSREHEARVHSARNLLWAAALILAAIAACYARPIEGRPVFGYAAALLAVGATALVAPAFTLSFLRFLRPAIKGLTGAAGLIAERSLSTALSRTSVMVAALATAVAMMVSVGTMVESFRETVQVWLTSQLGADIYLRAEGPATAGVFPPMESAVPERIKGLPGVAEVDIFHAFPFHYDGSQPTFGAGVMDIVRRRHTLRFMSGNPDEILASLPNRDRAIVSEPFADKHDVKVGQVLAIPLGGQVVRLTIAGIYFDYSNDRGFIITDRTTLLRYLPNQPVTNLAVYVRPGSDATAVRHAVEDAVQDFPVMVAANRVLREGAIRIFDRTFAVTWALEAIAIIVAMLGAANALLALVLDRRREIGLIRYLGGDRRQVRSMILAEAGLLGLLAVVLGLVLGLALSLVLIYVINKQSFGWTIQFHPPFALLAEAVTVIWIFTLLAGAWPARFAAGMEPSGVVQGE